MITIILAVVGAYLWIGLVVSVLHIIETNIETCGLDDFERDYRRMLSVKRVPKNIFGWGLELKHMFDKMRNNAKEFNTANQANDPTNPK